MEIREDDLTDPRVLDLLRLHLAGMAEHSPPEHIFALDVSALRAPDVTFWTAWEGEQLLGCGALREIDAGHGEVKSMRTLPSHLRRGVGARLLAHILGAACARGYRWVSLETGSGPVFEPSWQLYRTFGFTPSAPFGDYRPSTFNRFLSRAL